MGARLFAPLATSFAIVDGVRICAQGGVLVTAAATAVAAAVAAAATAVAAAARKGVLAIRDLAASTALKKWVLI
jgi:hypothetical protein